MRGLLRHAETSLGAVVCLVTTLSCAGGDAAGTEPLRRSEHGVLYGEDGRVEVYAAPDAELARLAESSSVALTWGSRLTVAADGGVFLSGPALGERRGLCEGERFADQPVIAHCSGVLLDDTVVLTAGHCFASEELAPERVCSLTSFVFGTHYQTSDQRAELSVDDVFGCRRLLQLSHSSLDPTVPDFALVELDRAAVGRSPAPLTAAAPPLPLDEALVVIGNGAGLPTKLAVGGRVVASTTGSAYFTADSDSFAGGSGSGVYDSAAELVGIQIRGLPDWRSGLTCAEALVAAEPAEEHLHVSAAQNALCAGGYPSQRLCSTPLRCGDGVCAPDEEPASCPGDCAEPCGDGVCLPGERGTCLDDCPPEPGPPPEWYCAPWWYADGARCHCDCGAVDPDCDAAATEVVGCGWGQTCNAEARCEYRPRPAGRTESSGCRVAFGTRPLEGSRAAIALTALWLGRRLRRLSRASFPGSRQRMTYCRS